MDLLRRKTTICMKFRANQFNRNRCQNCFRSLDVHSDEARQANKMNRKITKCGFLYVAPEGVDFTNSSQRSKRWQRRWFALYDDGELSYALDQHPDTVPQGVVDMTEVTEVKEAEESTGHSHSLRVTTQSDQEHYFKADSADEIKWWRDLLCIYSKQLIQRKMRSNTFANGEQDSRQSNGCGEDQTNGGGGPTLVHVVKNSPFKDRSQRRTSDPLAQAKVDVSRSNDASFHGTPRSVKNRKTTRTKDDARSKTFSEFDTSSLNADGRSLLGANDTNSVVNITRVSEDEDERASQTDDSTSTSSWTVRLRTSRTNSMGGGSDSSKSISSTATIKLANAGCAETRSQSVSDERTNANGIDSKVISTNGHNDDLVTSAKSENKIEEDHSKDINAALMHTLRKGWLMLRGRNENEWSKHWVVLAGLSLKMYKDAWAEDGTTDATVKIDLSDCVSVHPLSAVRNYGIEIKCKHNRYVLSALTPGIRDSWIAAMQQNLTATALENNNNQIACGNSIYRMEPSKKKRIAYVAPDSHRRDADSENDDEDEDDAESFRSNSRIDELSVSGRSMESSIHDQNSDDGETTATYSGSSTPRRRRSLSPSAVRRSPVSRVKERDTSRRQRSPAQLRTRSPMDNRVNNTASSFSSGSDTIGVGTTTRMNGGPVLVHSEVIFDARNLTSSSLQSESGARVEANVIAMLQSQLETVRQELERTRNRLTETESENDHLRVVTFRGVGESARNGGGISTSSSSTSTTTGGGVRIESEAELNRLRRTLQEAERDIWSKQEEIEQLTRKLDYSVNEISDTETVLSSSLQDLDNDRAKFSTLSEDWSRRVNAMERQLRETIRRLDERERELTTNERSSSTTTMMDQQQKVKEIPQQQQEQRRRTGGTTTMAPAVDRNETSSSAGVMARLESKLAEREATVANLTRKLNEMENSTRTMTMMVNGGGDGRHSAVTSTKADGSDGAAKKADDACGETEIRLESLRHYCHDQNRRLLATLRNETEFLQTMVEAKLSAVSNSSSENRTSIGVELKELADDLIAIHQYVGEIDRHIQPNDKSSPNDFMKDFNFKDVLNRLVEIQERFVALAKRDETLCSVRESDSSIVNENAQSTTIARTSSSHETRVESSTNDVQLAASSFLSPPPDTNQLCLLEPAVPFSTYWDYSVSALHADLARSLASYLEKKYNDSTRCTVLTSDDFRTILTETMALEACLLTEIANIIEASKNEERLRMAVKLRDVRNAYVVLRRFEDFLNDAGDDRRALAILEHRLDTNFFNILCEETKTLVAARLNELIATLPSSWSEKLRFGPADADARVTALRVLSKNLLRDVVVYESNPDESASCSTELLRSTILKDEIAHILSRVETNLDTFDAEDEGSSTRQWNKEAASAVVSEAIEMTMALCNRLLEKINQQIDGLLTTDDENGQQDHEMVDVLKSRLAIFAKHMKQSANTNGATPLNAATAKMTHIDAAFAKETEQAEFCDGRVRSQSDVPVLANLLSARAIVRGYRSWIDAAYGNELAMIKSGSSTKPSSANCDRRSSATMDVDKLFANGSKLAECVAHYEPLTRQLFSRILSNIGTKLVAVQLSVFYECRMREMAGVHEDVLRRALNEQSCDWCGNRKSTGGVGGNGGRDNSAATNEDGSFMGESSDEFNAMPGLPTKAESEHWRRLAPSSDGTHTNLAGEVAELEQEILEMQSYHNEELDALRSAHAAEMETLKRELTTEHERRKKLYGDMESMKTVTDHSMATLERANTQLIEEIRGEHRRELQRITNDYEQSLREEQMATRAALDALQKAHESELHKQAEKLKTNHYSTTDESGQSVHHSVRHDYQEALHEISRELSEVSTAYSAKCLENSRLEDELEDVKRILDQMANGASFADDEVKQHLNAMFTRSAQLNVMHTELNHRDSEIRRREDRIRQLESELLRAQSLPVSSNVKEENDADRTRATESSAKPSSAVPRLNGHEAHVGNSSSSSEELDEDDDEDDIAAEYQPKIARRRRGLPNSRRGDSRYHSTPNLGARSMDDSSIARQSIGQRRDSDQTELTPDKILLELRNVMGLPVSERRKYFENLCN